MSAKIMIYPESNQIDHVINFLNQLGVKFEYKEIMSDFNKGMLFSGFVKNKNFSEIESYINNGTNPKEFLFRCESSDTDVINFLIEKTSEPDDIYNLLYQAINLDIETIKKIIKPFPDDTSKLVNFNQGKLLMKASEKGNVDIIKYLLMHGAEINKCSNDPLVDAILANQTDAANFLLQNGSNIQSIEPSHLTNCISKNHKKSIYFILDKIKLGLMTHFNNKNLTNCLKSCAEKGYLDVFVELVNICGAHKELENNYDELLKISKDYNKYNIQHYLLLLCRDNNTFPKQIPGLN